MSVWLEWHRQQQLLSGAIHYKVATVHVQAVIHVVGCFLSVAGLCRTAGD
jgi:hypothetical protein